jgi:hypothetical protein
LFFWRSFIFLLLTVPADVEDEGQKYTAKTAREQEKKKATYSLIEPVVPYGRWWSHHWSGCGNHWRCARLFF